MVKKSILAVVIIFLAMIVVFFLISNSIQQSSAEMEGRTEADFTTQRFTVTELWTMERKKGSQLLSAYLFMKVKDEPIKLRLPWQANDDRDAVANQLKEGDNIEVKVLKQQLADARENGTFKAIGRFFKGDKREVTVFRLSANNKLLVDKDIHSWNDAQVTWLNRLTDNPFILFVFFIPIFIVIAVVKRFKEKKQRRANS